MVPMKVLIKLHSHFRLERSIWVWSNLLKSKKVQVLHTICGHLVTPYKTYEVLKTDPTPKYKRKLISILSRLKKENKIDEKQYKLLYPTTANTPRLYCTTKIHKKDNPIRPIVDYTDSLGYETSRALEDLLNPLIGNTEHHVKNSKDPADELSGVFIEDNEMFNSHDVVSLFTNTPIKQSPDIIEKRLMDDKDLKK